MPVILAIWEDKIRRIRLRPARANSLRDPLLQNNDSKMDSKCGSSGKVLALQVRSSECKPQNHKNKQNKTKKTPTSKCRCWGVVQQ
jgi:hypothetical protein